MLENLKLECMAIGSLPQTSPDAAMDIVERYFSSIPFWAQLTKKSKKEDMMLQFLEGMPSFSVNKDGQVFFDNESDNFYEKLETFFSDWEQITSSISDSMNIELLNNYAITKEYSSTFDGFIELIKLLKPNYAKGQIVGPFTLATSLADNSGLLAIYDETQREIIVKILALKALWQISQIKTANNSTKPIIFLDEPSITQLGTSAFLTISPEVVISMLSEIVQVIKKAGALCAIHCCGKCDWTIAIDAGVDIINLDAYCFAMSLSIFAEKVEKFLQAGGRIAWGIIPTLESSYLEKMTLNDAVKKFKQSVKYLTDKGISEKLIIDHSIVTPSCGAGNLSEELAVKAMRLTKELSEELKNIYKE